MDVCQPGGDGDDDDDVFKKLMLPDVFLCVGPSFQVSMVAYAKPSELKKDLNEQFREKFPNLNITLTKLRRYCA